MENEFNAGKILSELNHINITGPKPNVFMAVPTIYVKLIEEIKNHNIECDFSHIRLIVSGSAAMPRPISDEWESLTGCQLLERYGMTEIGMGLSQSLNPADRVDGSVGSPMLGVEARIRREDGRLTYFEANIDCQGELEIRTPGIFKEYWKLPEKTKDEFTGIFTV